MAFTINNLKDNPNVVIKEQLGGFSVIEYKEDLSSTSMLEAQANFFMSKSNMRNKQLMIELTNSEVMLSAGAMQYMIGNIEMTSRQRCRRLDAQYYIQCSYRHECHQTAL